MIHWFPVKILLHFPGRLSYTKTGQFGWLATPQTIPTCARGLLCSIIRGLFVCWNDSRSLAHLNFIFYWKIKQNKTTVDLYPRNNHETNTTEATYDRRKTPLCYLSCCSKQTRAVKRELCHHLSASTQICRFKSTTSVQRIISKHCSSSSSFSLSLFFFF